MSLAVHLLPPTAQTLMQSFSESEPQNSFTQFFYEFCWVQLADATKRRNNTNLVVTNENVELVWSVDGTRKMDDMSPVPPKYPLP